MHRHLLLVLLLIVGCGARRVTKRYSMPLTPEEGELVLPALQTVAENMGYAVTNSGPAVSVNLPEGDVLSWQLSQQFFLSTRSAKAEPTAEDLRALKVKADELWDLALELRQKSSVGAAVTITKQRPQAAPAPGYPMPQPVPPPSVNPPSFNPPSFNPPSFNPPSFNQSRPGRYSPGGQAPAGQCRSSLDCESGQWCRDYGGSKLCLGNNASPVGGPCTSSLDCTSGTWCRDGICR